MKAELADMTARLNASLLKKVCVPQAEVIIVQAQATNTATDEDFAYITYEPWRPDGTWLSHGLQE
jgi:hypothetical protein